MRAQCRPQGWAAPIVALGCVIALTACTSGSDKPTASPVEPSESPSVALVHNPKTSIASRKVSGDGFTIEVPARYEEKTAPGASGATNYVWSEAASGTNPPFIAMIPDPEPKADVIEQSKALELAIEADKEGKVTRSIITWPGSTKAVFLQWEEPTSGSGEVVTVWQLMTEREGGSILNVVAKAPTTQFEQLGFDKAMGTFTPTP